MPTDYPSRSKALHGDFSSLLDRRSTILLALIVLCGLCAPPASTGEDEESQLDAVRSRIEDLTRELNAVESQRGDVLAEIGANEIRTGRLIKQLHAIEDKLAANEQELARLEADKRERRANRQEQRVALEQQIRVSYGLGHQDYLKLLLNQEDPALVARTLVYHRYIQAARIARINALNAELEALARLERTIELKASALRELRREKSETRQTLNETRRQHEELLGRLGREIEDGKTTLTRLRGDEEKLAALVSGLREELENIPALEEQAQSFSSLRGSLRWPSSGRILHRFGAPRKSGNLSWQGVLIETATGTPVTAVSHGRVAFADWLRGFGLLLIIDHGEGYMSLYGRNQSLFKEVGDWVTPGELVALVGTNGGEEETGLYFEIRNNGVPINPARWCQGSPPPNPSQAQELVSG